ncbi:hypothetical protein BH23CHL2_BH23CHL2_13780 [soil metagenome]
MIVIRCFELSGREITYVASNLMEARLLDGPQTPSYRVLF